MNKRTLLLTTLMASLSMTAQAQQYDRDDDDDSESMIGLMYGNEKSIYVGGKDQSQLMPWISARWGNLYLEGPSLGYDFYRSQNYTASAFIELDGIFDENRDDSPDLADMGKFDSVVMAGLKIEYESEWGETDFSIATDASSTHSGYKAEFSYGYPMMLSGWMITPEISLEWASKDINQYYYGVTEAQARAGRPVYTADSGVNYGFGLTAMYPIMENHALMFRLEYEAFSSAIKDSPIVDQSNTTTYAVGYTYRF